MRFEGTLLALKSFLFAMLFELFLELRKQTAWIFNSDTKKHAVGIVLETRPSQ
jgi:hypothetical protein